MFKLTLYAIGIAGPFVIWAAIYLATERSVYTLQSMLRVLRAWRWISWITAVSLWIFSLTPPHLPWSFGGWIVTFSIGLSFPELWLKARLKSSSCSNVNTNQ